MITITLVCKNAEFNRSYTSSRNRRVVWNKLIAYAKQLWNKDFEEEKVIVSYNNKNYEFTFGYGFYCNVRDYINEGKTSDMSAFLDDTYDMEQYCK